jgi:hypothetical protein
MISWLYSRSRTTASIRSGRARGLAGELAQVSVGHLVHLGPPSSSSADDICLRPGISIMRADAVNGSDFAR